MEIIEDLQKQLGKSNGSVEEMQYIFYETSQKLMNEYVLKIDNLEIELKELEFYYYDEKHPDCYTHGDDEYQKDMKNILYVHKWNGRYTNNPNRGGIDITFGNGEYYGGILIRGIKIDEKFIAGPANIRQKVAKLLGLISNEKDKFNHENLQKQFNSLYEENKIVLKEKAKKDNYKFLYVYSREGLNRNFSKFTDALYRFFAFDYFNATKNIYGRNSIKYIGKIRAVSSFIFNIEEKYATDISLIKDYCKEQNYKYDLCYYMESLKQKLKNNECNKNKDIK